MKTKDLIIQALACYVSTEADNGEFGKKKDIEKAEILLNKLVKIKCDIQKKYCLEYCGKVI